MAAPSAPSPLTTASPAPVRQHIAYLDGMRALAALFVVLCHCDVQLVFLHRPHSVWIDRTLSYLATGHNAVDVFIVLSGFCLAMPVVRGNGSLRGGALHFFRRRARRILPPYYLALGFSLLLIWLAIGHATPGTRWGETSVPVTVQSIFAHLLLVQDAFAQTKSNINYALWSVSVEWRIYFVFPLLLLLRRRWGSLTVAAAATALSYLIIFAARHTGVGSVLSLTVGGISPQLLGLFAVGILGADIAYGKAPVLPRLRQPAYAMALLGVTTAIMVALPRAKIINHAVVPIEDADFFVGVWALSILVAAANAETNWLNRLLSWRPLVFLGTFAYSIYLIHAPLIQLLWQYVFVPLQGRPEFMFLALAFGGTPLIIGVAYLFFLACERPFLNTRRQETMAETERGAALSPAP